MISIIAPVHNEEENIREFVERTASAMNKSFGDDWQLLLIDDKSTDNSLNIIKVVSAKNARVRYFSHIARRGQAGCFETGFNNASGDIVITIDSDLQVFPEDIPLLIEKMEEGYELINAIRKKRKHHFLIVISSNIYNMLMKIFFNCPVKDAASNFTAIETKFVKGVKLIENDHRYIIPIAQRRGLRKISEVDVRHIERKKGKAKYGLNKAIAGFPELLRAWWRIKNGFYDKEACT